MTRVDTRDTRVTKYTHIKYDTLNKSLERNCDSPSDVCEDERLLLIEIQVWPLSKWKGGSGVGGGGDGQSRIQPLGEIYFQVRWSIKINLNYCLPVPPQEVQHKFQSIWLPSLLFVFCIIDTWWWWWYCNTMMYHDVLCWLVSERVITKLARAWSWTLAMTHCITALNALFHWTTI